MERTMPKFETWLAALIARGHVCRRQLKHATRSKMGTVAEIVGWSYSLYLHFLWDIGKLSEIEYLRYTVWYYEHLDTKRAGWATSTAELVAACKAMKTQPPVWADVLDKANRIKGKDLEVDMLDFVRVWLGSDAFDRDLIDFDRSVGNVSLAVEAFMGYTGDRNRAKVERWREIHKDDAAVMGSVSQGELTIALLRRSEEPPEWASIIGEIPGLPKKDI